MKLGISDVAKAIAAPQSRVCLLTGAGVSTSSGIPDFRSPGGMYDSLRPDLLTASTKFKRLMKTDPTYVVSWEVFSKTSLPYLEVRRPFILGINDDPPKWKPTASHFFARLLHDKGKLIRVFSQNIDGLDYNCGVPSDKVLSAHGSLGTFECESCKAQMQKGTFVRKLKSQIKDIYNTSSGEAPSESTPIICESCNKPLVKPATVLYGRQLPPAFYTMSEQDMPTTDVLLVLGTSLTVHPAAGLPEMMTKGALRVVINREATSGSSDINFRSNPDDVALVGGCDDVVLDLIEELGWLEDFAAFADEMADESKNLLEERLFKKSRAKRLKT